MEVARLLLDSGAQVNMPADSFESPLTLAACGGHVELAALLIERGANLEEVNDEGYTPLMEAAREGHEEMVALLLAQGKIVFFLNKKSISFGCFVLVSLKFIQQRLFFCIDDKINYQHPGRNPRSRDEREMIITIRNT